MKKFSQEDIERFKNLYEYMQTDEWKAELDAYTKSKEHKRELRELHREVLKGKSKRWLKTNYFAIINLLVGIATLIFAILAYLK